jgi:hypothetical protein
MVPLRLVSLAILGIVAGGVAVGAYVRRHRKTADDRERERRAWLTARGRIIDGTVTDVREVTLDDRGDIQLVIYQYDVAGVSYEASQDVTLLRHLVDLHSCRLGLPASIKYDPHNPGNSIVISETWTGLRKMGKK